jgi:hypothetical protein
MWADRPLGEFEKELVPLFWSHLTRSELEKVIRIQLFDHTLIARLWDKRSIGGDDNQMWSTLIRHEHVSWDMSLLLSEWAHRNEITRGLGVYTNHSMVDMIDLCEISGPWDFGWHWYHFSSHKNSVAFQESIVRTDHFIVSSEFCCSMQMHSVSRYKITGYLIGDTQISACHFYRGSFIRLTVRIKYIQYRCEIR